MVASALEHGAGTREIGGEATGEVRICGANTEKEEEITSLLEVLMLEVGREATCGRESVLFLSFRNETCFKLGFWIKDLAAIRKIKVKSRERKFV